MDSADPESLDESAPTLDLGSNSLPRQPLETLDNYRIEAELGRGGMGEVYLATEQPLNRQVALKVLPAANRISATQVKRFLLEAQAVAQLSHDHIVPIYHVGECCGTYYFAMRYIPGHDLAQIIRSGQRALSKEPDQLPVAQAPVESKERSKSVKASDSTVKDKAESTNSRIDLSAGSLADSKRGASGRNAYKLAVSVALIGQAVADALQHAHQHGIVHRDIKPSNLMLDNTNKIWVTDFGLAQLQGEPALTQTGDVVGTLRYMSPEQASTRRAFIDHRTDIYSLGVTLYELATLQKACRGNSLNEILRALTFERPIPIRKINPKLPRDLETIISKATERNPSDRYQSAAEMASDLLRFANGESLVAKRPSKLKAARNWIWDRPVIAAMTLGMLLVFTLSTLAVAIANHGREVAVTQRANEAESALSLREGQQLQAAAYVVKDKDPGLGIAAGIVGAEAAPGSFADLALMAAIDSNHELRTMPVKFDFPGECVVAENGEKVVLCKNQTSIGVTKQNAQIWNLRTGLLLGSLENNSPITAAAFIDSDRYLITKSTSRNVDDKSAPPEDVIQLWDANTLALLKSYSVGHACRITKASFTAARRHLIIPNSEKSATVVDLPNLTQSMVLPTIHEHPVLESRFSPDGSKIATLAQDNLVIVWDSISGTEVRRYKYPGTDGSKTRIFFSHNGEQVCVSGDNGSRFVEVDGAGEWPQSETILQVSAQSRLALLQGNTRRSIVIYNTESHKVVGHCDAEELVFDAKMFMNDQMVALILDEAIAIFDTSTGQRISRLIGHRDRITSLDGIANKPELISLCWDGTARHWHVHSDLNRRTLSTKTEVNSPVLMTLSPDKSKVLIGTVRATPTELYTLGRDDLAPVLIEGNRPVSLINGTVLTCLKNGVALWDLKTRRRTHYAPIPGDGARFPKKILEIPNRQGIALLSQEGDLYIWHPLTDDLTRYLNKEGERIKACALDPSGNHLLVALSTSELIKVNIEDMQRERLAMLPSPARGMELNADGKLLLITGSNNTAFVINMETNELGSTFSSADASIKYASFVGNDQVITHGGLSTKRVILWNLTSGQEMESVATGAVYELAVNKVRNAVAVATKNGAAYWDIASKEKVQIDSSPCENVAFVRGQVVVATGNFAQPAFGQKLSSDPMQLITWDPATRKVVATRPKQSHVMEIIPQGETDNYLVATITYGVEYVDVATPQVVQSLIGHTQPLIMASFGPTSDDVFTVATDGVIIQHSVATGVNTVVGTHEFIVSSATISHDRRLMLTADQSGTIRYWDLPARKVARELDTNGKSITDLAIAADNSVAAAVLDKSSVKYWDLRTGSETDFAFEDGIRQITWSPDSQLLAVVTGKTGVFPGPTQFDLAIGIPKEQCSITLVSASSQARQNLSLDKAAVGCQFIDAGKKLAVLTMDGKVQVLDTQKFEQRYTLEPSRRIMQLMQPSHESKLLVTASKNQMHLWNAQDGSLLSEISVKMSWSTAALTLPNKLMQSSTDNFYILFNDGHFYKYPTNVLAYAKKIAPRALSTKERQMLLRSPLVN